VEIRVALKKDLPEITEIVRSSALPHEDCHEHWRGFFVAEQAGRIVAAGGLQVCGPVGLVRSVAVLTEHRGKGIGAEIYGRIETRALELGIDDLYLLTETASRYFEHLGFVERSRSDLPAAITATKQFRELCPRSATVMCKKLGREADPHRP
jgi:N-acetylglutamate synthase-like GNAT family acetyltransferase